KTLKTTIKLIPFNKSSLDASNFDGNLSTICLIHGYTDNGTKPWIIEAKDEFLASQSANIISLNYSAYVSSNYDIAVCNAFRVAEYAASVFNWISENSELTGSRLHNIGHSLGAHVAGIMGYYMILLPIGKIIRISGLKLSISF
ncbi:Inactive pancreatic lipase-related protein 1, partial [Armadillidium vulgare]